MSETTNGGGDSGRAANDEAAVFQKVGTVPILLTSPRFACTQCTSIDKQLQTGEAMIVKDVPVPPLGSDEIRFSSRLRLQVFVRQI
jgi:hypothetical protein